MARMAPFHACLDSSTSALQLSMTSLIWSLLHVSPLYPRLAAHLSRSGGSTDIFWFLKVVGPTSVNPSSTAFVCKAPQVLILLMRLSFIAVVCVELTSVLKLSSIPLSVSSVTHSMSSLGGVSGGNFSSPSSAESSLSLSSASSVSSLCSSLRVTLLPFGGCFALPPALGATELSEGRPRFVR